MNDYIFLMHNDAPPENASDDQAVWGDDLSQLKATGRFGGGSSIGQGVFVRRDGRAGPITTTLGGYITVQADSLDDAAKLLAGNPVFERGGTVEIRDLPRE